MIKASGSSRDDPGLRTNTELPTRLQALVRVGWVAYRALGLVTTGVTVSANAPNLACPEGCLYRKDRKQGEKVEVESMTLERSFLIFKIRNLRS